MNRNISLPRRSLFFFFCENKFVRLKCFQETFYFPGSRGCIRITNIVIYRFYLTQNFIQMNWSAQYESDRAVPASFAWPRTRFMLARREKIFVVCKKDLRTTITRTMYAAAVVVVNTIFIIIRLNYSMLHVSRGLWQNNKHTFSSVDELNAEQMLNLLISLSCVSFVSGVIETKVRLSSSQVFSLSIQSNCVYSRSRAFFLAISIV